MSPIAHSAARPLSGRDQAALGLISGAVIAYELFVMRVFANGGWSHFGSTVVSIAMFGFGVFSTVLCLWKNVFSRRLTFFSDLALLSLGPAMVLANTLGQSIPFNPMFLISDPKQKYYLVLLFLIYFVPFVFGAMFIGLAFLAGRDSFGRVYFANMSGSGLGGALLFGGMYLFLPVRLFLVPLSIWALGTLLWFGGRARRGRLVLLAAGTFLALLLGFGRPQINVSEYKGVSYARNFPDSEKVYEKAGPFGLVEVYASSYFHFAPGLSDTAALYLKTMPKNAYYGLYLDGNGPIGLIKRLPESQSEYFRFLPMAMPYLIKDQPEVLVMQFGGGISTHVALKLGAVRVTVAEGNPLIIQAVRDDPRLSEFTGRILSSPRVNLVETDGRIHVRRQKGRFDVVDLSLADSTGLSMAGGSSIHEKYMYTLETLVSCMEALKPEGVLAVTVWNKEDPPKATLKLIGTLAQAARTHGSRDPARDFFICHTFLSTLTVLYKEGGFTPADIRLLNAYCRKMSFDIIHQPGSQPPAGDLIRLLKASRDVFFNPQALENSTEDVDLSAGNLYRHLAFRMLTEDPGPAAKGYVFDSRGLTNDRPYLAGFIKPVDIPRFLNKLEAVSDEWGYLLLWATLLLSVVFGILLMSFPVIFGWQAVFSRHRGKMGTVIFFICLGLAYMLIEIVLISKSCFLLGQSHFIGIDPDSGHAGLFRPGKLRFGTVCPSVRRTIRITATTLVALIGAYAWGFDQLIGLVGAWPYGLKILVCLVLLFPLAFLMGFPFAIGMATLANLKKDVFFVWAWGINGSFSVVGSVMAPVLAVLFGLKFVLLTAAVLYLLSWPSFMYLKRPDSV